jgi:DNA-binding CsgD family transcriptional regulator
MQPTARHVAAFHTPALTCAEDRHDAGVSAAILGQLLDQLLIGVILVDTDSRPWYANREARRILASHDGLAEGPDGLRAATAASTCRLRHALALLAGVTPASEGDASAARFLSLPRPGPSRRAPLLLTFSALSGPPGRTVIFIHVPEHLHPVSRGAMAEVFGLTPREAALAALLADGHELRHCAGLLAMGEGTARNHLKHVFEKTMKHSQGALVSQLCRMVGPYR